MNLAAWGDVLVGIAYSLFGLRLIQQDRGRSSSLPANGVVAATVMVTALWGWMGLAHSLGGGAHWLLMSQLMDTLRYGGWYTFLLMLLHFGTPAQDAGNLKRMAMLAATLTLLGIGFVFLGAWRYIRVNGPFPMGPDGGDGIAGPRLGLVGADVP